MSYIVYNMLHCIQHVTLYSISLLPPRFASSWEAVVETLACVSSSPVWELKTPPFTVWVKKERL